jgi:hypothetical protein
MKTNRNGVLFSGMLAVRVLTRTVAVIIALLLTTSSFAQVKTKIPVGTPNQASVYTGAVGADSAILLPTGCNVPSAAFGLRYTNLAHKSLMYADTCAGKLYYFRLGTNEWSALADSLQVNALTWQDILLHPNGGLLTTDNEIDGGQFTLYFRNNAEFHAEGGVPGASYGDIRMGDPGYPTTLSGEKPGHSTQLVLAGDSVRLYSQDGKYVISDPEAGSTGYNIAQFSDINHLTSITQGAFLAGVIGDYLSMQGNKIRFGSTIKGTTDPSITLPGNRGFFLNRSENSADQTIGLFGARNVVKVFNGTASIGTGNFNTIYQIDAANDTLANNTNLVASGRSITSFLNNSLSRPTVNIVFTGKYGAPVFSPYFDYTELDTINHQTWNFKGEAPLITGGYNVPFAGVHDGQVFYNTKFVRDPSSTFTWNNPTLYDMPVIPHTGTYTVIEQHDSTGTLVWHADGIKTDNTPVVGSGVYFDVMDEDGWHGRLPVSSAFNSTDTVPTRIALMQYTGPINTLILKDSVSGRIFNYYPAGSGLVVDSGVVLPATGRGAGFWRGQVIDNKYNWEWYLYDTSARGVWRAFTRAMAGTPSQAILYGNKSKQYFLDTSVYITHPVTITQFNLKQRFDSTKTVVAGYLQHMFIVKSDSVTFDGLDVFGNSVSFNCPGSSATACQDPTRPDIFYDSGYNHFNVRNIYAFGIRKNLIEANNGMWGDYKNIFIDSCYRDAMSFVKWQHGSFHDYYVINSKYRGGIESSDSSIDIKNFNGTVKSSAYLLAFQTHNSTQQNNGFYNDMLTSDSNQNVIEMSATTVPQLNLSITNSFDYRTYGHTNTSTGSFFITSVNGLVLKNITMAGNTSSFTGITIQKSNDVDVDGVHFMTKQTGQLVKINNAQYLSRSINVKNITSDSVEITNGNPAMLFTGNHTMEIAGNKLKGTSSNTSDLLEVDNSSNVDIHHNTLQKGGRGIYYNPSSSVFGMRVTFNNVDSNSTQGIYFNGTNYSDYQVENNYPVNAFQKSNVSQGTSTLNYRGLSVGAVTDSVLVQGVGGTLKYVLGSAFQAAISLGANQVGFYNSGFTGSSNFTFNSSNNQLTVSSTTGSAAGVFSRANNVTTGITNSQPFVVRTTTSAAMAAGFYSGTITMQGQTSDLVNHTAAYIGAIRTVDNDSYNFNILPSFGGSQNPRFTVYGSGGFGTQMFTTTQQNAISGAATGQTIGNSDSGNALIGYTGTAWLRYLQSNNILGANGITATNGASGVTLGAGDFAPTGNLTLALTKKVTITTGTNASAGTATLSSGTVTVNTTAVTASSLIFVQYSGSPATVSSVLTVPTKTAGTSFVITALTPGTTTTATTDANVVQWWIIN